MKGRHRPGVPVGHGYNSIEMQRAEGRVKGCIYQRARQENHTAGRLKERMEHGPRRLSLPRTHLSHLVGEKRRHQATVNRGLKMDMDGTNGERPCN